VPLVRWLVLCGEDCDTDAAALLAWFRFWFNPAGTGGNGSLSEPAAAQVEAERRLYRAAGCGAASSGPPGRARRRVSLRAAAARRTAPSIVFADWMDLKEGGLGPAGVSSS